MKYFYVSLKFKVVSVHVHDKKEKKITGLFKSVYKRVYYLYKLKPVNK